MVHWWKDPAVEAHLQVLYAYSIFLLLGIYGYVVHCVPFVVKKRA